MATLKKKMHMCLWTFVSMMFLVSSAVTAAVPSAADSKAATKRLTSYTVRSVDWERTPDQFILSIKGDAPPTYTMYELFEPLRVIIDVADASMSPSVSLPMELTEGPISRVNGKVLEDKEPFIARIELYLSEDNSYTVERIGNNIIVKFAGSGLPIVSTESSPSIMEEALTPDTIEVVPEGIPDIALAASTASTKTNATVLYDIEIERSPTKTNVYLRADGTISDYRKVQLSKNVEAGRPDRMYIDVKNVRLSGAIPDKDVGTALAHIRTGQRTDGFRIVFDSNLDELFDYSIVERADGMLVTISEPSAATAVMADIIEDDNSLAETTATPEITSTPEAGLFGLAEEEPEQEAKMVKKPSKKASESRKSSGLFSGYTKQRITVDFYKIDLHNVFRLFGEISNLNMVVDEGVGGSLTLALNDVPWDFALDIILNLKNLKKEERYNTIVISKASKKFEWPEAALQKVELEINEEILDSQQSNEGLRVQRQRQEVSEEVREAKKLIHLAQNSEKMGNYASALPLYEDAFSKWPENIIIAKRIAALCLVQLGQNAKAVHYAKVALRANPTDYSSALQAAIGLAKMDKGSQAEDFFKIAISGETPSSEALSSYASFFEESEQFDRALEILRRHEDIHGDNLDTMLSKARIHDKQGQQDLAAEEYQAILLSGYEIPPDLARYIQGRVSLADQQ